MCVAEANWPEYGLHDGGDAEGERWGYYLYLRAEQVQFYRGWWDGDEAEAEQVVMDGCVVRQHNETMASQPGSPSRQVGPDMSLRKHKSGILREHNSRLIVYNDAVVCSCISYSYSPPLL
jgi:hypothetical protein